MRKVTKTYNVYKFEELDKETQQKVIEEAGNFIVDDRFSTFEDTVITRLKEKYGIDAEVGYSIAYQQGDGLHFTTDNFLTKEMAEKLKSYYTDENYHKVIDQFAKYYKMPVTHSVHYYEYASRNDIEYPCCILSEIQDDLQDELKFNNLGECETAADRIEKIFDDIHAACQDEYLTICKGFYNEGLALYEVTKEDVLELIRLNNYEFLKDGSIYSD